MKVRGTILSALALCFGGFAACGELKPPPVEPFYAEAVPPPRQELRWSNGKLPRTLDPARAAASPETDVVRALYEGLTELDKSLNAAPAVAENWEPSEDHRTWTFRLRKDARWSNGDRVTARDFVRSWKRLATLGDTAANSYLFQNIVSMGLRDALPDDPKDFIAQPTEPTPTAQPEQPAGLPLPQVLEDDTPPPPPPRRSAFGVQARDDSTLRVSLVLPDKDFPKLVANPIFRPIHGDGKNFESSPLDAKTVTNGAFRMSGITDGALMVVRSDIYWNRNAVELESVRFVPMVSAEAALDGYRRGEVDLVTNAAFEPLALKLLAPYEDFRRTAHSALNYYEVNSANAPFSDRRVREALAIAIDRTKLTEGDLEGTMRPAYSFGPLGERNESLALDVDKARELLANAGFPLGKGFPVMRLVINRNETQQRVARSVARMWKQNLNIEASIIVKEPAEIDDIRASGEFDLIRRGVVLPVNDELINLTAILGGSGSPMPVAAPAPPDPVKGMPTDDVSDAQASSKEPRTASLGLADPVYDLQAIPLYFPISYALAKPYVVGYELNGLDAVSLADLSIDNNWKPKQKP